MAHRVALAMVLVAGCSATDADVKGEERPVEDLGVSAPTTDTTTTTISASTTSTVEAVAASSGRPPASSGAPLTAPAPTETPPPDVSEGGGAVDDAFWRRLADCECSSGHCGGGHVGWFQFSPDTAAKVGIDGSEGYEEQRAAAIVWADRIHPRENTTSGWPTCWDEAAQMACPNGTCDGSGVVQIPTCTPDCTLLRHSSDCPSHRPAQCEACARAALGEDLA